MGRISFEDMEHYGGNGGTSYFSLKNDKDVARVRIMVEDADDMQNYMYACHKVDVDGYDRYVSCLRSYNDEIGKCPFCRDFEKSFPKIFIPLYNIEEDSVQIWERGKLFTRKISSVLSRYGSHGDLVSHVFEIERNGKVGDTNTTYELYEVDQDTTTFDDLPEAPEVLGSIVLDKTADDMEFYLNEGYFPPLDNDVDDALPIRRRGSERISEQTDSDDRFMNIPEDEYAPAQNSSKSRNRTTSNSENTRRTPSSNQSSGRRTSARVQTDNSNTSSSRRSSTTGRGRRNF